MKTFSFLTGLTILGLLNHVESQSSPPFTQGEVNLIRSYFEANMDIEGCYTGFVTASPSSVNPDYFYGWQRDTAISMHTLQYTATNSSDFNQKFQNYVTWVLHAQGLSDPNGINVLGEPKFNCSGFVYNGGWCRPQNDGPASRAIALIYYANWLIANGQEDYVKEYLYTPSSERKKRQKEMETENKNLNNYKNSSCNVEDSSKKDCGYDGITEQECLDNGCCWDPINPNPNNYPWCFYQASTPSPVGPSGSDAIPRDLDYVASVYSSTDTCDLWEEVSGVYQFYTSMVQYRALINGASLAQYFGDYDTATSWNATAAQIVPILKQFDNNGFISEKERNYDCSVVLAPLYGGSNDVFPVTDTDIINTIGDISTYFASYFYINQADDDAGIPGVLLGRYEGDTYTGCSGGGGGSQGHAWILCSNALGDFYYRNAIEVAKATNPDTLLSAKKLRAYAKHFVKDQYEGSKLLLEQADLWESGKFSLSEKQEVSKYLAQLLVTQGDAQMIRLKYHISGCNYHMSEQLCETNGYEVGANDLTWAYGTFISAWHYRGLAIKQGVQPFELIKDIDYSHLQSRNQQQFSNYGSSCALCTNQC